MSFDLPTEMGEKFAEFYESVGGETALLDPKTAAMIRLAAAMAFGCTP